MRPRINEAFAIEHPSSTPLATIARGAMGLPSSAFMAMHNVVTPRHSRR
jgi:hypothetical protein